MRERFFYLLFEEMKGNENIFILYADMGLGIFEKFHEKFPDRCLNVGIAEQNMIAMAAGLCSVGFRPFCYTISNFIVERSFEFIRNDICIPKYPITLIGSSTGFDNGKSGSTHHSLNDIGLIKTLPLISIYSPSTQKSIKPCFDDIIKENIPAYIRIGKGSLDCESDVNNCNYFVNKSDFSKTLIITHGNTLVYVLKALNVSDNFSVLCINKLKPIDDYLLKTVFHDYRNIVVVEEQFSNSGLYNIVCQYMIENNISRDIIFKSLCPSHEFSEKIGDSSYYADIYGYDSKHIL